MEEYQNKELTPEATPKGVEPFQQPVKSAEKETELIATSQDQQTEGDSTQQKIISLFDTFNREREAISHTNTKTPHFLRPRHLTEHLTKPLSSYFGSLADAKAIKRTKQLIDDGASFGLGGGVLSFKIIKAIELLLYEISELYMTDEQRNGKDIKKRLYLLGSTTENPTSVGKIKENSTEATFTGTPIGSPYPSIITTPYNFAKKVKGGKVTGADVNDIIDELNRLEKEKRVIISNGIVAHTRPFKDVSLYTNESGQTILHIVLSPMFAQLIGQKFVKERKDILSLLNGVSKDMTLSLYEILIMRMSLGYSFYHTKPQELKDQIAKLSSYKGKPKRMREDFNYSIEVMKRIRLISDYSETATEVKFIFNRDHLSEVFDSYPETRFSAIKKSPVFNIEEYGKFL